MVKKIPILIAIAAVSLLFTIPVLADCGEPGDIIWSELDYDQPGTDDTEFIEIRFPNGGTFENCELHLVNGGVTPPTPYHILDIGTQGAIPANKYFVWGSTGVANRDATIGDTCATNCIQNGNADGFALVDTSSGSDVIVWLYSYEGTFTYLGTTSTDIGVAENNSEPNLSCNNGPAVGIGDSYLAPPTPGNPGPTAVTLTGLSAQPAATLPALALATLALGGLLLLRRRRD